MKYLKLFLLIICGSFFIFAFARADSFDDSNYIKEEYKYPYSVEVISALGKSEGIYRGLSLEDSEMTIAKDLGVEVYPEDKLEAFPYIRMKIGSKITLHRAPMYKIYDSKKLTVARSWKQSVGELLKEKKITLGVDDKINFSTDTKIEDGMVIRIIRVEKTKLIETQDIDYNVLEKEDPDLKYGLIRIEPGEIGERRIEYLVIRQDGEEVSRTLLKSETTKQPRDKIRYIGTKIIVLSSVSGDATITTVPDFVVSANYPYGTLIRITNRQNGVSIIETVNATWGTASAPSGVVLDLSMTYMNKLGWDGTGRGPAVLVEEIER